MIPVYLNSALLFLISGVHIYWGLGGNWGRQVAVPEREGMRTFQAGRVVTLVVAVLFGFMALFFLYQTGRLRLFDHFVPKWLNHYGLWVLTGVFLLRAIGDFRYIGFTKKVRSTRFAELDTRFYSPLCLFMSYNTVLVIDQLAIIPISY